MDIVPKFLNGLSKGKLGVVAQPMDHYVAIALGLVFVLRYRLGQPD